MNENSTYMTITHIHDFSGSGLFRPGIQLILQKDHENPYDDEAILVRSLKGNKYGYVANSSTTVCRGTHSAGYLQHLFEETAYCVVRFTGEDFAIAEFFREPVNME
ncbi:MAG: HIRAN domain-containing protein [Solobacterium sp.]|nr:HIRAN domain-containing protein [Solobacterium sp.]